MSDSKIYTPDTKRGDVQVQLSYPTRTGLGVADEDRRIAALTITDRTSGQILVSLELTAAEYLSIMSSTGTTVSGAALPARPERIGRRRQNTSTDIPRGYPGDTDARIAEVVAEYQAEGWETEVRRQNYGHSVIARRWVDDEGNPVT